MPGPGLVVLAVATAVAVAIGMWFSRRNGVFVRRRSTAKAAQAGHTTAAEGLVVTAADLGSALGRHATLVQFSTSFCAPCRATRVTLSHVAAGLDGVAHVEVDAESNLDLVRRFAVHRTPTTVLVDGDGSVLTRASGAPRPEHVRTVLSMVPEVAAQLAPIPIDPARSDSQST